MEYAIQNIDSGSIFLFADAILIFHQTRKSSKYGT